MHVCLAKFVKATHCSQRSPTTRKSFPFVRRVHVVTGVLVFSTHRLWSPSGRGNRPCDGPARRTRTRTLDAPRSPPRTRAPAALARANGYCLPDAPPAPLSPRTRAPRLARGTARTSWPARRALAPGKLPPARLAVAPGNLPPARLAAVGGNLPPARLAAVGGNPPPARPVAREKLLCPGTPGRRVIDGRGPTRWSRRWRPVAQKVTFQNTRATPTSYPASSHGSRL